MADEEWRKPDPRVLERIARLEVGVDQIASRQKERTIETNRRFAWVEGHYVQITSFRPIQLAFYGVASAVGGGLIVSVLALILKAAK